MTYDELVNSINPEIYASLKRAVELGKWPNGVALTKEQKENCLRAIIFYESKVDMPEDQRTGFIDTSKKTEPCGSSKKPDDDVVRILH